MTKYEEIQNYDGSTIIKRITDDGVESWIPVSLNNVDYQAYLKSLEEQANDQSL
jgi:hypothetical protein